MDKTDLTPILVAVASGPPHLIADFVHQVRSIAPDHSLHVVSEFPPPAGTWIPYRFELTTQENLERCHAEIGDRPVRLCALLDISGAQYQGMKQLAFGLAPGQWAFFNQNLRRFLAPPRSLYAVAKRKAWRLKHALRLQLSAGGRIHAWASRVVNPRSLPQPFLYRKALHRRRADPVRISRPVLEVLPTGIAVVIPSRNGRELLARALPLVLRESPAQAIVVDNGSDDGTAAWIREAFPEVEVVEDRKPLTFSVAVNRGIARVRVSHVCLLNNDMEIEPGFFSHLRGAFDADPDLFCATAQIFFPEGRRREETGKAVMPVLRDPQHFPLRCDPPIPGENFSPVLYGSGGCSLYETAKLRALGNFDESFAPAYVEDLDIGYRGWQAGWPTVFCANARVLHHHRATTARYFRPEEIDKAVQRNYLRFLTRSVASRDVFERLWREAIVRLNLSRNLSALRFAARASEARPVFGTGNEELILALGSGDIAVFPGIAPRGLPVVAIATCYAPFPLSHGGAVRMFNLMRRAAQEFDQVILYFSDTLDPPPQELLEVAVEVVVVRRHGSHIKAFRELPDAVQDFRSLAFEGALREAVRRWKPFAVQLEFTQLAQYAEACAPAKTILVEHDITIDLYEQLANQAAGGMRWELERQLGLWRKFEMTAWEKVSAVVAMSERDRVRIGGSGNAIVLPNGVDTNRFQPFADQPEPRRILFIGSFAHLPNLIAIAWFVNHVWPLLTGATLHVIGGSRADYFLNYYRDRIDIDLNQPGIQVEEFVADVRDAYRRAEIVIAPLQASAGTNIKVLEAMAMGKPVVSTSAGIHGLHLHPGRDVIVVEKASEMADAIRSLMDDPELCTSIGTAARQTALLSDWDRIAERQTAFYQSLRAEIA